MMMQEYQQYDWLGKTTPILIIAVTGRIGSGTSFVAKALVSELKKYDYKPKLVKVTKELLVDSHNSNELACERIKRLQSEVNELRKNCKNSIIGARAIEFIANDLNSSEISSPEFPNLENRLAYVIDSLKHPEEIEILKAVFRDSFWTIGVVADDITRKRRLQEQKNINDRDFEEISEIDADEKKPYGQKVIKTILKSDYYFANNYDKETKIPVECQRLLNLLFQGTIETPRQDEYGIHLAFMAAKKSACLSRQVGASILSEEGIVLSTGYNDVPQFGGGLYTSESERDNRCFAQSRMCHNDFEKSIISDEIVEAIKQELTDSGINLEPDKVKNLKNLLLEKTRLKQLIEFTRAVHAEMNSILGVARAGKTGLVGSTMYVTTYPCHNCAKHIIDAGIKRVIFVEPYEKSLAQKLHSDAFNKPDEEKSEKKINLENYGGVSPSRYSDFFSMKNARKDNMKLVNKEKGDLHPIGMREINALSSRLSRFIEGLNHSDACHLKVQQEDI